MNKAEMAAWVVVFSIILWPLYLEDTSGLVYEDQNVLLDHLAALGLLIGMKMLWGLYRQAYPKGYNPSYMESEA